MNENIADLRNYLNKNVLDFKDVTLFEDERNKIDHLIRSTVEYGEANSALLIGPRGAGKTNLMNEVLVEISKENSYRDNYLIVKLNGFIHTNDNLALKSITLQMNLVNVVEGKVFGNFAENFAFLLAALKAGQKETAKSVIFILDEFDLFCNHHNQTLLYNLFDISQSAQTAICVIGITCRLDVIELLEKRVKSRFSHRQFFLFANKGTDEKDLLKTRLDVIKNLLSVERKWGSFGVTWNKHIDALVTNQKFHDVIQRLIDINANHNSLKIFLVEVIAALNEERKFLTVELFEEELNRLEKDETVLTLQDLNVLELCLVIAMKHHLDIYNNQPMNFEMVLTRYTKFANSTSSMQVVERSVVMKAFEHLQTLELVSFINTITNKLQKEYQTFRLVATPAQITEAVKSFPGLPTEVVQWANSSLF